MATRRGIEGVVILDVAPGSGGADAGLEPARVSRRGIKPRDLIVAVDSQEVGSTGELASILDGYAAGDRVTLAIVRDGRRREIEVTLDPGA